MAFLDDNLQRLLPHFDGLTDVSIEMKEDTLFEQNPQVIAFWRKPYIYLASNFTDRAKIRYGFDWAKRLDEVLIRPLIHAWLESKGEEYSRADVCGMNVRGMNEYFLWKAHQLGLDMSQEVTQFPILKPYWDMIQIGWNPFENSRLQSSYHHKCEDFEFKKTDITRFYVVGLDSDGNPTQGTFDIWAVGVMAHFAEFKDLVGRVGDFIEKRLDVLIDKKGCYFEATFPERDLPITVRNKESNKSKTIIFRKR